MNHLKFIFLSVLASFFWLISAPNPAVSQEYKTIYALVGPGGELSEVRVGGQLCLKDFGLVISSPEFKKFGYQRDPSTTAVNITEDKDAGTTRVNGKITDETGKSFDFEELIETKEDHIRLEYTIRPNGTIPVEAINLSGFLPLDNSRGGKWYFSNYREFKEGNFPADVSDKKEIFTDHSLSWTGWVLGSGHGVKFSIPRDQSQLRQIQLQDNRLLDENLQEFELLLYLEGKRDMTSKDVLKFSVIIEPLNNEYKVLQIEKNGLAALSAKDGRISAIVGPGGELKEVRTDGDLCLQHFGLLAYSPQWRTFGSQRMAEEVSVKKDGENKVEIRGTVFDRNRSFSFKEKVEIVDDRIKVDYALKPNTDLELEAISLEGLLPAKEAEEATWYIFNQDGLKKGGFDPSSPGFLFKETKYEWSGWILNSGRGIKFLTPDWTSKMYQVQLQDNRTWGKEDAAIAFFINSNRLWKSEDFVRFSMVIEPFRVTPELLKTEEDLREINVLTKLKEGGLAEATIGAGGQLETVKINGKTCLKDLGVVIKDPEWRIFGSQSDCIKTRTVRVQKNNIVEVSGKMTSEGKSIGFKEVIEVLPDKIKLDYTLEPETDIVVQSIGLSGFLPVEDSRGASWHVASVSGLRKGGFPVTHNKGKDQPVLALDYEFDEAGWTLKDGYGVKFLIPDWKMTMSHVQLQDDREWDREEFELAFLHQAAGFLTKGDSVKFQAVIELTAK
jgi:hypothetical protein